MSKAPKLGRPTKEASAKLNLRIRHCAFDAFVEHGLDGTTMEMVATAAGVTRRTLYARYPDKRAMFADVVPWAMSRVQDDDAPPLRLSDDLREALLTIGRAAVARVLDPQVAQLTRIAMSASHLFPEFAKSTQTSTWSPRHRLVVGVLRRHAERGEVAIEDPDLAANQFLALVSGFQAMLAVFGVHRDAEEEERRLQHAVTLFLHGVLTTGDGDDLQAPPTSRS